MTAIFEYFVQSSIILVLFYLVYFLFLRNERLFRELRFYLIISVLLSLFLPFVKIPYTVLVEAVNYSTEVEVMPLLSGIVNTESVPINHFTVSNLIITVYLLIAGVLLIRSLIKVNQVYRLIAGRNYKKIDDFKVIVLEQEIPAFTFFGYIVISRDEFTNESCQNILTHEKVHAQQKHWIDLLLVEVLTIVFWFNPFVWLFQISIKQTHELLADDGVIAHGFSIGQYQALLINQIMGAEVVGLANNFNYSINKKRMIMMSKDKSPLNRRYKLLLMLPIIAAVVLFNLQIVEVQAQEKTIKEVVNVTTISGQILNVANEPIAGVAILVQNSTVGTISDMDGKFSLIVPLDANIAFSGVDIEKVIYRTANFIKQGTKTKNGYNMDVHLLYSIVGEVKEDVIYEKVDQEPEFQGGIKALQKHISMSVKYPKQAQEKGITGKVYVTFVINKAGEVNQVKIARGVAPSLDAEAIRVIKSLPNWRPGIKDGKPVDVSYTMPINFDLNKGKRLVNPEKPKKSMHFYKGERIFVIVEEMPEYPGGSLKLKEFYTKEVSKLSSDYIIGKRCYVTFILTKEGFVKKARVVRGTGNEKVDAKAIEIVENSVKWKPGKQRGQAVHVSYTVPVNFGEKDKKNKARAKEYKGLSKYKGEDVHVMVDQMPIFPGGHLALQEFIENEVKYPAEAKKNGIEGKVYITFLVNKAGEVDQAHVVRGVEDSLDEEALRVVNLIPKWKPGTEKGKVVNVNYTVPINFALKSDKKK